MRQIRILWTDDEIDLLKPHLMFLEEKGYAVDTATNGSDALEMIQRQPYDLIFLDENMPGLSGIETLNKIRLSYSDIPVVMITKNEEEDIMDTAIGSKIDDYLIKPVNPRQILLSIKKNIDVKRLVSQETSSTFLSELNRFTMQLMEANSFSDWAEAYRRLVYWELELESSEDKNLHEVLENQRQQANEDFYKYISRNYLDWINDKKEKPLLSPNIIKEKVLPLLEAKNKVIFILIDNLRYDQWKVIQPDIQENLYVEQEEMYCSILPTATQYARNSIFAGLMPYEIQKLMPKYWVGEEEEESKNSYEKELLESQFKRLGYNYKINYQKILNVKNGSKIIDQYSDLENYDINVLVYNFVDILSHARTNNEMIKELASDDPAYRSITRSWFTHSYLKDLMVKLASSDFKVIITTDHGTIQVNNPVKVIGDKNTSANLRYKQGKSLTYDSSQVFEIKDPEKAHLPKSNLSSRYIFSRHKDFFVYPNNYNQIVNYYKNTFQHGGISLEEMVIPLITLRAKS